MNGKTFFVDLSRCTGCRGCQVACKQWKNKPVEPTENTGSHQNPPDLSWQTLKVVRFTETSAATAWTRPARWWATPKSRTPSPRTLRPAR